MGAKSASVHAKKVEVLVLREIAPVASLGQINNIGSDRARKFRKEGCREQRKIMRQTARAKKAAVSKLRESALVASLSEINNIRSDHAK